MLLMKILNKWFYFIIIAIILLYLSYAFLSNQRENMTSAKQILTYEIEKGKSPSVQYYFFNQDSVIDAFQMGFADIKHNKAPDNQTTYNAFSVTKTFTALAILQLNEKGIIDINNPVIEYLPDFSYGEKITVKHLLNHSAGIPNPIPLSWIHTDREHETFNSKDFFKSVFEKNNKVKFKPDYKFSYSNLGYVILGQIIEKVSGKRYKEYITENIIQKFTSNTNELTFNITDKNSHAKGYHKQMSFSNFILGFFIDKNKFMGNVEGKWRSFNNFYVNGASYGGLIGKPSAFVKYIQELLKDNSSLISQKYKQILFHENKNTGMCLSWFTGKLNGVRYFAHAGGGGGYYCEIRIYPDIKKGSVIFFNRTGMSDERYLDKVDKFYVK